MLEINTQIIQNPKLLKLSVTGPNPAIRRVLQTGGCLSEFPWVKQDGTIDHQLQRIYQQNARIVERGHVHHELYDEYTFRLPHEQSISINRDIRCHIEEILDDQANAFKINFSFTLILRNRHTGQYSFYHAHDNASLFAKPFYFHSREDLDKFLALLSEDELIEHALRDRPDSNWTFFNWSMSDI